VRRSCTLAETYLYTVEAFKSICSIFDPAGCCRSPVAQVPPRDSVKLFATAVTALSNPGVASPSKAGADPEWNTSTLLVKNGAVAARNRNHPHFCAARSFDLAYYPGMTVRVPTATICWMSPIFIRPPRPCWKGRLAFR
jgi:hypothetical protein